MYVCRAMYRTTRLTPSPPGLYPGLYPPPARLALSAAELHGNMSQTARLESLEAFRRGDAAFLLATDVAARGLDIQGVQVGTELHRCQRGHNHN